jgi:integrase
MATLRRVYYTRPVPLDAVRVTVKGKPSVRFLGPDGVPITAPLTNDGTRCRLPSAKWYGQYTDANGKLCREPLSTNKDAARLMLSELLKRVENEKAGIIDRFAEHRKKPLTDHLADWSKSLRSNANGAGYVVLKESRVRCVIEGCGWVFPSDMTADRLETFLTGLRSRRPDLPPMPTGVEWFTAKELSRLLGGITRQSICALIRRERLDASGKGRARRFPRATVDALRGLKRQGSSPQTSNHYLQAVRQFARWLVDNDRLDRSPFARLKPMNARLHQRRRRGELDPTEMARLISATGTSATAFRGLTGPDRVMLYQVAVGTGFRAGELAALVPDFFDLDATPPVVVLPAELSKNRKGAVQPLGVDLAADLRRYLAGRQVKQPVWPGSWSRKAADMLRADLDAAGVPVEVDSPEGVETRDFHALRACFISNVIRAGADLKQAMTLARHSDPRLTTARYARTRLHDLGEVVDNLPGTTASQSKSEPITLRLTGTDDGGVGLSSLALPLALGSGSGRVRLRTVEDEGSSEGEEPTSSDPSKCRESESNEDVRGDERKEARPGIEPGMTVLQTVALPLGDRAVSVTVTVYRDQSPRPESNRR